MLWSEEPLSWKQAFLTTSESVAGDAWVVGQACWTVGDINFGIGCSIIGSCLSISSAGRVTANAGSLDIAPKITGYGSLIQIFRRSDKLFPAVGDRWDIGVDGWFAGAGGFGIGRYLIQGLGGGAALLITAEGVVNVPGALQVGGIDVITTPWVSCRINADLTKSKNRGKLYLNFVKALGLLIIETSC